MENYFQYGLTFGHALYLLIKFFGNIIGFIALVARFQVDMGGLYYILDFISIQNGA